MELIKTILLAGACFFSYSVTAQAMPDIGSNMSQCQSTRYVAYLPSYRKPLTQLPVNLTHAIYAFVDPYEDGSLSAVPDKHNLLKLQKLADVNQVKVGILIGGWNNGDDSAFEKLSSTHIGRDKFITSVVSMLDEYALDGVDLDWEFPAAGEQARNFNLIIDGLSAELKSRNKFLSIAVPALGPHADSLLLNGLKKADFINVMAYDASQKRHSSLGYAKESLFYWQAKGIDPGKINLGIPFYSRPQPQSYAALVSKDPLNASRDGNGVTFWNGIPTVIQKTRLAIKYSSGLMAWELGQDETGRYSLASAIGNTLQEAHQDCLIKRQFLSQTHSFSGVNNPSHP